MSKNDKPAMPDFFKVPYRIMFLPGMVHNYALIYQQIFKFWCKKSNCSILNAELAKLVGCSSTTVKEALRFFERKFLMHHIFEQNYPQPVCLLIWRNRQMELLA
jgi:hypothetical protein